MDLQPNEKEHIATLIAHYVATDSQTTRKDIATELAAVFHSIHRYRAHADYMRTIFQATLLNRPGVLQSDEDRLAATMPIKQIAKDDPLRLKRTRICNKVSSKYHSFQQHMKRNFPETTPTAVHEIRSVAETQNDDVATDADLDCSHELFEHHNTINY